MRKGILYSLRSPYREQLDIIGYHDRTKMLKTYMERQWPFATSMAESFKM